MASVTVPAPPPLVRIPRVELVRTGQWPISTGTWTATREDLQAAVAALDCPAVHRPGIKIGHTDDRFTDPAGDGEPLLGFVDNLAGEDDWNTLVGDFAGVPAWLGAADSDGNSVISSAYPQRSIEGIHDFKCQIGHTHPFVLTAVALLGGTHPGVGTLQSLPDLMTLYGVEAAGARTAARAGGRVEAHQPGMHNQLNHGRKSSGRFEIFADVADAIVGDVIEFDAGNLEIVHDGAALRLGFKFDADGVSGTNTSGPLSRVAASELADAIDQWAVGGAPDDEDGGGSDRILHFQSYAAGSEPSDLPNGYAGLSIGDGGKHLSLELFDNEGKLSFTGAEAKKAKLSDAIYRYSAAQRFQGEYGRLDVYLSDENRFGFRMFNEADELTAVEFDGKSWAGISKAIDIVWEGFDSSVDVPEDDEGDIDVRHVKTNVGKVRVARTGPPDNFDLITVTPAEGVDGDWAIYVSGAEYRAGIDAGNVLGHMGWVEETAENLGFYDSFRSAKVTARRATTTAMTQADAGPGERSTMPNPSPTKVAAGVTTEDVRRQYYESAPSWDWWITEFHLDPLQLIVCDDRTGKHHRVPVTITGEEGFEFGEPTEVLVRYVDAGSEKPVAAAAGEKRLVYASRAESRPGKRPRAGANEPVEVQPVVPDGDLVVTDPTPMPVPAVPAAEPEAPAPPTSVPTSVPAAEPDATTNQEDDMSLSAIRARLGLGDDADEAAVLAALEAKLPTETGDGTPDTPAVQPDPVPVAAASTKPKLPEGVVAIDEATLNELRRNASLGAQAAERQRVSDRDRVIDDAVAAGKIPPARKDHWVRSWEADPDGTKDTLASLEPGLVIPVVMAGATGTGEEPVDTDGFGDTAMAEWAADFGIDVKELARG